MGELFQSCCVVSVTAWLQFDEMYYIISIFINQRRTLLVLIISAKTCAVAGRAGLALIENPVGAGLARNYFPIRRFRFYCSRAKPAPKVRQQFRIN